MFDNILHVFHVTIRDTGEPNAHILIKTIPYYVANFFLNFANLG